MKKHLLACFAVLLAFCVAAVAQNEPPYKVSMDRVLWHDNVDKQQKRLLNEAGEVKLSPDPSINTQVAQSMIKKVDNLQRRNELDTSLNTNIKKKYLRSLETMLKGFNENWPKADYTAAIAPALVPAFEEAMGRDLKNESIKPVIDVNPYGVGKILVECFLYPSENPGVAASRTELLRKYCGLHQDEILSVLRANPNVYFADSLVKVAAYRDIPKLYDYAQARNTLGTRIRNHPDTLVRMIATMANSKSGRLYFPFLENLLRGKITLADIDRVKDDNVGYYRLMVQTRIEYAGRLLPPGRDTAREMKSLTAMMARKAKEYFIREINALHSVENENVRFKRLEGLTAQELYYLAVLGEDEVYTSSFVKGIYPRIFQRMQVPKGDSLLMTVNGDYFRKFIKMCAGYNTLNDFLSRMEKGNDNVLMKAFVIGLEKTEGTEEAVDVADSYSSIMDKNPQLAAFIEQEATANYHKNNTVHNKKGTVIYNILQVLFRSADTTQKLDLSKLLGIPPVYTVDNSSLRDDSGRIVMQVFFYGDEDKDGQNSYASFMGSFRNRSDWKVVENKQWVAISTTKGRKIMIYANKPLYTENDADEAAITALSDYLFDKKLKPSIFVHRGHSYHVKSTMKRIMPSARIVILGSCGGYNNINEVLNISQDAHIISSKQTGTMHVNEPIIQAINSSLLSGRNIDWVNMWRELTSKFTTGDAKEKFDDYIPPYKNLGAIFIKAYNKAMAGNEATVPATSGQ
ncbi:MAG: hypothetical protein H7Y31_12125 [Chitinophagaceae bacterium]|nr:hypothetical protein [Chitinophagaceae bacterium]